MKKSFKILLIFALLLVFPITAHSKNSEDFEFEFYYQTIEGVKQINNPNPEGFWENAKSLVKGVTNKVKSWVEQGLVRNFFPGEGSKLWYSDQDPNIAYEVDRVKVRDEAHLLELMGAKDDESVLTDGQKSLLEMYRFSKSEALKERIDRSYRSGIKVFLTDTTGFEDEKEYPHVRKDFWPVCTGFTIQMNSMRYNYPDSAKDAQSTFIHEFSHSMDRTFGQLFNQYGLDGTHYSNEKLHKRVAFLEGFAMFNEMLEFKHSEARIKNSIATIRIESKTAKGEYEIFDATDPKISGADLLEVEGVNALILFRLATELPDGRNKVFNAFKSTNFPWTSLKELIRKLTKDNPDMAAQIAAIIDESTLFKLSDAELLDCTGNIAGAINYLEEKAAEIAEDTEEGTEIIVAPAAVKLSNPGKTPFE